MLSVNFVLVFTDVLHQHTETDLGGRQKQIYCKITREQTSVPKCL